MIVKLNEPLDGVRFVWKDRLITAVLMKEDFMVETDMGWLEGRKGDYLVEAGERIRFPCAAAEFEAAYKALPKNDRRIGRHDRREHQDRRDPNELQGPA